MTLHGYQWSSQPPKKSDKQRIAELTEQRDELLAALKKTAAVCAGEVMHKNGLIAALEAAREAIAKAEKNAR